MFVKVDVNPYLARPYAHTPDERHTDTHAIPYAVPFSLHAEPLTQVALARLPHTVDRCYAGGASLLATTNGMYISSWHSDPCAPCSTHSPHNPNLSTSVWLHSVSSPTEIAM